MEDMIVWVGRLAGIGGAVLCAVAAGFRVSGRFWVGAVQAGTLLQVGIAAMILGCFCLLAVLTERAREGM
jgi:hypothetical protein